MEVPVYYNGGMILRTPEKQGKEDHFAVEDLLDFSNDGGVEDDQPTEEVLAGEIIGSNSSADSSTVTALDSCSNASSGHEAHLSGPADPCPLGSSLSGDICDPFQDLAELEWLSNFVEESFSSEDLEKMQLISGLKASSSAAAAAASETRGEVSSVSALSTVSGGAGRDAQPSPPMFLPEAPVPAKARSKRSRAAPCSWSSRLLVLSPTPSAEHDVFVPVPSPHPPCSPAKKPKKKDPSAMAASDGRRCLHCATDKTPQWRTGPMGPKTLCNACGVRYKSGRLVPEYRPAASPTFVLSKHSNSHRKVLELRRQKEMQHHQQFLHHHHQTVAVYDASMAAAASSAGDDFLIHHRIGPDFRQLI